MGIKPRDRSTPTQQWVATAFWLTVGIVVVLLVLFVSAMATSAWHRHRTESVGQQILSDLNPSQGQARISVRNSKGHAEYTAASRDERFRAVFVDDTGDLEYRLCGDRGTQFHVIANAEKSGQPVVTEIWQVDSRNLLGSCK